MGCCCSCCREEPRPCSEYSHGQEGFFECHVTDCGDETTVWGTNPYTADSCVCAAARHAGVVGANGGTFRVARAAGHSSYAGSREHGVTSYPYGTYELSITISRF
jgi:hypothetical protein